MLSRLQELQKQQQLGQFTDGQTSNLPMSMSANHAGGGQFPNLSGTNFDPSGMVASSNLSWMHQNVSSTMQGISQGSSYSHGGLMLNPSLQQPDMSLYGSTSRRGNLGQYAPMQGVSYNSEEKHISQLPTLANSFFGDKHSVSLSHAHSMGGSFMLKQGSQDQGSVSQASIYMLNSGISSQNLSQVNSLQNITSPPQHNRIGGHPNDTFFQQEQTKQSNDSRSMTTLDPLEEKILFDTEDCGWNTSFSKLAALGTTEFLDASSGKGNMDSFPCIQNGRWSALMQSDVADASTSETGMQEESSGLSFQNTESSAGKRPSNIMSNDKQSTSDSLRTSVSPTMKAQHSSQSSHCQHLPQAPDPAVIPVNDCVVLNNKNSRDVCQGNSSSNLSMSGMIRNEYAFNQHAVDNLKYMPLNGNKVQKDYKSTTYDHQSSGNFMAVDMLYKRAAEIYGNPNHYRGDNSCDSYTSKLSQAYVAQKSHACLNAEDSESSARSSHKSQNQAMCISSPVANSQQECFSHFDSTNPMIKGNTNVLADALSKGSPASDISTSFDSQHTSEHDKECEPRDHGNTVQGFNVRMTEPQELNGSNISNSQGATIPDRFCFQKQNPVPGNSRFVNLGYGKGQTGWTPLSSGQSFSLLQGVSLSQSCARVYGKTAIETANLRRERNSLEGVLSMSKSAVATGTYHQNAEPLNLLEHVPSQKDSRDLPSPFGLSSRSLTVGKNSSGEHDVPMIENAVVGDESAENYLKISSSSSDYAGLSVKSGLAQRSFPETTTSRALPIYSQTHILHNVENVNNSAALYNLNKQWIHDIPGQRPVPRMQKVAKNPIGRQFDSCSFDDKSSNMIDVSTDPSALNYMYSHKLPMLQDYSYSNISYDQRRHLHMRAHTGSEAEYVQNEYIKKQQNYELLPGLANPTASSERSLPSSMPLLDGNEHLVLSGQKKRKTAMDDCLPWYQEVLTTHRGLLDISATEEEWAMVTNRLIEKYVDVGEGIEEVQPIVRAKRRLIVTTDLMQLVFRPPSSSVLSIDSRIEFEIVVYSVTKLALADACGLANIRRAYCKMPHDISNTNGGIANRLSDKATELLRRTQELETQIERSSKSISIVDILVERQELEKLGIINHFAKYHSRVPESKRKVKASSSTGMASVRPFLQRYVRAVPVPATLPEGIQCFSL